MNFKKSMQWNIYYNSNLITLMTLTIYFSDADSNPSKWNSGLFKGYIICSAWKIKQAFSLKHNTKKL